MIRFLMMIALCVAGLVGFGIGSGILPREKSAKKIGGIHPERELPVTEYKSFAILLIGHNDSIWCERSLQSIFAQDYDYFRLIFIDDGSQDDTYEKVRDFVIANKQEHRVILMKSEAEQGEVSSLYRAAGHCLDREVVIPLLAHDWFAGPQVLSSMNRAFQNSDVWIACGKSIRYPSYEFLEWKKGTAHYEGIRAFYGALLKQLPLQNAKEFNLTPLLELAGGRSKAVHETMLFRNETMPRRVAPEPSQHFKPLAHFPKGNVQSLHAEVLLVSNDSPLHLYAALESIHRFVTGFDKITVQFHASEPYASAYSQIKESFPNVVFLKEGDLPKLNAGDYVLIGDDTTVFKEFVDLKTCMATIEKTHADGFFFESSPTPTMSLTDGIVVCAPANPHLALCKKDHIKKGKLEKTPQTALAFEKGKTAQLSLELSEELLSKFYQGLKIDLDTVDLEERPDFTPR